MKHTRSPKYNIKKIIFIFKQVTSKMDYVSWDTEKKISRYNMRTILHENYKRTSNEYTVDRVYIELRAS